MVSKESTPRCESSILSVAINRAINRIFPDTIPPHVAHMFTVSPEYIPAYKKKYPNELLGSERLKIKKALYDLGAETINNWLLIEACDLVLDKLPPGVSQGLKVLLGIYHLDLNLGHSELKKMKKKLKITDLTTVINDTLFSHDPNNITSLWNIYKKTEDVASSDSTPEDFILAIGRLACPDEKKISSKMQQLIPHWFGDYNAVTKKPGLMLKPEWSNLLVLSELFTSMVMFSMSNQSVLATMALGSSTTHIGLSVLDEMLKNISTRAISKTHFGIRRISWNNKVK